MKISGQWVVGWRCGRLKYVGLSLDAERETDGERGRERGRESERRREGERDGGREEGRERERPCVRVRVLVCMRCMRVVKHTFSDATDDDSFNAAPDEAAPGTSTELTCDEIVCKSALSLAREGVCF